MVSLVLNRLKRKRPAGYASDARRWCISFAPALVSADDGQAGKGGFIRF
jgi:hypothetical protein